MLGKKTTPVEMPQTAPVKNARKKRADTVIESARFRDEIQLQAYYNYLWREKNNTPGSSETDWLEAEKDVSSRMKAR